MKCQNEGRGVTWRLHSEAAVAAVAPVAAAVSPVSPPVVVVVVFVVLPGSSEVGDAMMETGRSCTRGWASAPLGVVIRVTCRQRYSVTTVTCYIPRTV